VPDATYLPIIYGAPEDADPWDEAVWLAANPAIESGFRSLDEMRTMALQAKEIPGREQPFRQLYLNQWGSAAAARWIALSAWDACASTKPLPAGRGFLGLDLSTTTDLSALVLLVPDEEGGYDIRAEFWCPRERLAERARADRVPYPVWEQQGWLTATQGDSVDYSYLEARVKALMAEREIVEVAVDPWNARDMTTRMLRDGIPVVEVTQTMANLTSASKAFETLVLSRKLRHDANPVLRWNVSNAVADTDGNDNIKPSKKHSHERIDGVSALVTGLARAMVFQAASYEAIIL
jgi:phage terminase large subunit-like protein